jgi:hypothetical protein
MSPRIRKLAGAVALLVLIAVYALLVMATAAVLQVNQVGKIAELAFYAVAGLLWVLPAGWIIRWMQQGRGNRSV